MTITETKPIADIAAAIPSCLPIFEQFGIDFCCGGRKPLGPVCSDRGIPFDQITRAIETAQTAPRLGDGRDWTAATLSELVGHIVTTYHYRHREELPRLQTWARRAAAAHGTAHTGLFDTLERLLAALATELTAHMDKEERVLFPAICSREQDGSIPTIPLATVIDVMEREHDDAGALLEQLRRITGEYAPPAWACATVTALYQGLAELETALHLHVHLENNVLFPRAVALPQPASRP